MIYSRIYFPLIFAVSSEAAADPGPEAAADPVSEGAADSGSYSDPPSSDDLCDQHGGWGRQGKAGRRHGFINDGTGQKCLLNPYSGQDLQELWFPQWKYTNNTNKSAAYLEHDEHCPFVVVEYLTNTMDWAQLGRTVEVIVKKGVPRLSRECCLKNKQVVCFQREFAVTDYDVNVKEVTNEKGQQQPIWEFVALNGDVAQNFSLRTSKQDSSLLNIIRKHYSDSGRCRSGLYNKTAKSIDANIVEMIRQQRQTFSDIMTEKAREKRRLRDEAILNAKLAETRKWERRQSRMDKGYC